MKGDTPRSKSIRGLFIRVNIIRPSGYYSFYLYSSSPKAPPFLDWTRIKGLGGQNGGNVRMDFTFSLGSLKQIPSHQKVRKTHTPALYIWAYVLQPLWSLEGFLVSQSDERAIV